MRALTEEFGILLIFDEVKTGFRFARGGAAEFFGITPDLATYAKAMGNGYPAAAFGGRAEVMSVLPDKVSHGGTYAGNRVAAAAAVKTLEIIRDTDALETIHATGRRIQDGLREVLNPTGLPYHVHRPSLDVRDHVRRKVATEYRDWATTDHELYDAIAMAMQARGAMPEPDSPRAVVRLRGPRARRHRRPDRHRSSATRWTPRSRPGRRHGRTPSRHGAMSPPRRGLSARRRASGRWCSTGTPSARSIGRRRCCWPSGECQGEAGVTELARRLGLHKSTASRLLATLQKRGLVEQDEETGKYRLGLVVIRLAERAERTLDLRGIAMPELERLARLTHETTGLGILDGDALLTVAQADGPNLIAVGDWTGRATPLHCVASGKVLLAALAEREVLRIVRRGLVSYTERTITSSSRCSRSWHGSGGAATRPRSASTSSGLNAVAAPVHDARGNVIAAVDIWGPAFRLTPRRDPGARRPGPRGRGRDLGPARWPGPSTRHGRHRRRRDCRSESPPRPELASDVAAVAVTSRDAGQSLGYDRMDFTKPPWSDDRRLAPQRRLPSSCSSSSSRSSRCGSPGSSSTASSRRCSIARRPRARPRSCRRSRSGSGWTRSTSSAATSSGSSSS